MSPVREGDLSLGVNPVSHLGRSDRVVIFSVPGPGFPTGRGGEGDSRGEVRGAEGL